MIERDLSAMPPPERLDSLKVGDVITFYADEMQQTGFVVGLTKRKPIRVRILFLRWASGYDCLAVDPDALLSVDSSGLTAAKQRARVRRIVRECKSREFPKTTKRAKRSLGDFFESYFARFPISPDSEGAA